jgi:hypothetical protein
MRVTRDSIWRNIPKTPLSRWEAEFRSVNSPLQDHAKAMYDAAGPHGAVVLAFLWREQLHWTYEETPIPASFNNPLSLAKPRGGVGTDRWMQFVSPADCVKAWVRRLNDPGYKNGVYADDVTLAQLIYDYAPPSENDTEKYIASILERITNMPAETGDPTVPELTLDMTPGLIAMPGYDDDHGTFTKRENVGCNYFGPRLVNNRIDFLFIHRALGSGARNVADWLERADVQGLTDFVIDARTAYMIRMVNIKAANPPSGWAQGPYRAPTAALRKVIDRLGGFADYVNRYGESLEVTEFYDSPIAPVAKRDIAQWIASRAHDRGIEFDMYPYTPEGTLFIFSHWQSCGKDIKICAGPVVDEFVFGPNGDFKSECTAMVVELLRAAQVKSTQIPPTTNNPKPPSKPSYHKPVPIPALQVIELDDVAGLAAVTTKEGDVFEPVNYQVVAIRETPRFQRANIASKYRVGPNIKAGEDFNPAWKFKDKTGEEWYVTPYWTRVRVQDTKVVFDDVLKN